MVKIPEATLTMNSLKRNQRVDTQEAEVVHKPEDLEVILQRRITK
jgi:hypothetical protein